jgi:SAM-dependent methyltransferase
MMCSAVDPITAVVTALSRRARAKRAALFRSLFTLDAETRILDLGSAGGAHISAVLKGTPVQPANVYVADIRPQSVERASREYGYTPVLIAEDAPMPFPDGFFDIVYCSSVIEHVTVPKHMVWELRSARLFRERALARQEAFAAEIRRVGMHFFVQTPYKHFPIETHSWLPFLAWLPRPLLIGTLRVVNPIWITKTAPDWHLLDKKQLARLFEGALIIDEKVFGLTKSLMAVKL